MKTKWLSLLCFVSLGVSPLWAAPKTAVVWSGTALQDTPAAAPLPEDKAANIVYPGVEVEILKRKGDWVEVQITDPNYAKPGWMETKNLLMDMPVTFAALLVDHPGLYKTSDKTNLETPVVKKGTLAYVLKTSEDMFHIRTWDGREGWISKEGVATSGDEIGLAKIIAKIWWLEKNKPTLVMNPIFDLELEALQGALYETASNELAKLAILVPAGVEFQVCAGDYEPPVRYNPPRSGMAKDFALLDVAVVDPYRIKPPTGTFSQFATKGDSVYLVPGQAVSILGKDGERLEVETENGFRGWVLEYTEVVFGTQNFGTLIAPNTTVYAGPSLKEELNTGLVIAPGTLLRMAHETKDYVAVGFLNKGPQGYLPPNVIWKDSSSVKAALVLEKVKWLRAHNQNENAKKVMQQERPKQGPKELLKLIAVQARELGL